MQELSSGRVVWRVSGIGFLSRLLRKKAVHALSRNRTSQHALMIACIPGDDIGDQVIANGWYEDSLLAAIFDGLLKDQHEAFASGIALDVGANIGNHALWLSQRFSKIVAFEPNPICWRILEANLLLNSISNVILVPSGLSDRRERVRFHMNRGGNIGNSGVDAAFVKDAVGAFDVDLVVGDDVLSPDVLGGARVKLLKIDVEGHELAALKGLSTILTEHQPIVLFESHGASGVGGSDDIVNFLATHGLDRFYTIERDRPSVRSRALRALRRILKGEQLIARSVVRPEDRPYGLVVACSVDLLASGVGGVAEVTHE